MNEELKKRLEVIKTKLQLEKLQQEIRQLEADAAKPEFWQSQAAAKDKMQRLAQLQQELDEISRLEQLVADNDTAGLTKSLDRLELKTFLSGVYDDRDVLLSIHAGQGGIEAMDWAQMLQRMYLKYFEKKGWPYRLIAEIPGEEAGIKSATLAVKAPYAYGYLKHEAGTHRLVRQSPFNADHLRQTSFALVEVLPQLPETSDIEIRDDDLEWQFFRASTQGGQNVQKVSTAVRLKHKPTGIVVTSENERYQEQNRKIALGLLKAKLWVRAEAEAQAEQVRLKAGRTKAAWGTQIRSYVLHPYKMVKDLRTGCETGHAEAVLDGNLEEFIEAEVKLG